MVWFSRPGNPGASDRTESALELGDDPEARRGGEVKDGKTSHPWGEFTVSPWFVGGIGCHGRVHHVLELSFGLSESHVTYLELRTSGCPGPGDPQFFPGWKSQVTPRSEGAGTFLVAKTHVFTGSGPKRHHRQDGSAYVRRRKDMTVRPVEY